MNYESSARLGVAMVVRDAQAARSLTRMGSLEPMQSNWRTLPCHGR
jgi:hypothetical protein